MTGGAGGAFLYGTVKERIKTIGTGIESALRGICNGWHRRFNFVLEIAIY